VTAPIDPRPPLDEIDVLRTREEIRRGLFGIEPRAVTLGRFLIEGIAGTGATGMVYAAYDPGLQRRIALKVIRPDDSSRQDSARGPSLIREARSLAKLTHPNVVPVYEVGEIDGEVFVAMELVDGTNLRQWFSAADRRWRQVLMLFDQALAGLEAAHAVGLIHRDFKPDNVLIGADRRVRVADFGLTSEPDERVTEAASVARSSASTGRARAAAGTPAYMAPEVIAGAPATTSSDIYSVGVSLHEALWGVRPPRRPSAKPGVPAVPNWVQRVVLRATASEPGERYASVAEMRAALRRDPARQWRGVGIVGLIAAAAGAAYGLGSTPVDARCSGAQTELSGVWDGAALRKVEAAMLATQAPYAAASVTRTRAQLDDYAEAWVREHTEACQASSVRHEQSAGAMDLRMACLRRAKVGLSATVQRLSDADRTTVDNADRLVAALPNLTRCADVETLRAGVPPPDATLANEVESLQTELAGASALRHAGHYERAVEQLDALQARADALGYEPLDAEVLLAAGLALDNAGRYDDAATRLRQALRSALSWQRRDVARDAASSLVIVVAMHQGRADEGMAYAPIALGLLGPQPDAREEARVRGNIATGLQTQGKFAEAESEYRAALALELAALGPDHRAVAISRNNLATLLESRGKFSEAEAELRRALGARVAALGPDHPHVATARYNLGNALQAQGKYDDAGAELRAALASQVVVLGPDHPDTAASHNSLGLVLAAQGRYEDAEAELRVTVAILVETVGPKHTMVAVCRGNLGGVLSAQGRYAEAEIENRATHSILLETLGPQHPDVATARNNIATSLEMQHAYAEAEEEYRAVLALRLEVLNPEHPDIAQSRANLGNVLGAQGLYTQAEQELRAALSLELKVLGAEHPGVAHTRNNLATVLESQGKLAEAETEYRAALERRLVTLGAEHPSVANSRKNLAGVLYAQGTHLDEALELAEAAWSRRRGPDIPKSQRADASLLLAQLLWQSPAQRPRALDLAKEAQRLYVEAGPQHDGPRAEAEAWLRARAAD